MVKAFFSLVALIAVILLGSGCGKNSPTTPDSNDTEDLVAPSAPSFTGFEAGPNKIRISWNRSTEPDVVGYNVYWYNPLPQADNAYLKVTSSPVSSTNYEKGGLEEAKTYYFRVSALDRSGNESKLSRPIETSTTTVPENPDGGIDFGDEPKGIDD